MSDESNTTTESTGAFQRYAEDSVGRAMDQVSKTNTSAFKEDNKDGSNYTETNQTTHNENKPVVGKTNQTTEASFEDFAQAELDSDVFKSGETYKGLDYNKVAGELSEDAQKLLANFRADYTRKTQELARERKALEQQQKALIDSEFVKNINEKAAKEIEFDPFDDASVQAKIEQEVARRMREMIAPMQQQYELQQNQMELESFKAANPDLQEYRQDVAKLLLQNENLSLQQAYFIVKGQKQNEKARQLEEELSTYKATAKEYGLMIGGSSKPAKNPSVPKAVKDQGAYAIYQWLAHNKSK